MPRRRKRKNDSVLISPSPATAKLSWLPVACRPLQRMDKYTARMTVRTEIDARCTPGTRWTLLASTRARSRGQFSGRLMSLHLYRFWHTLTSTSVSCQSPPPPRSLRPSAVSVLARAPEGAWALHQPKGTATTPGRNAVGNAGAKLDGAAVVEDADGLAVHDARRQRRQDGCRAGARARRAGVGAGWRSSS